MSAVESPAPPAGGLDSGGLVPSNDRMARHRADAQQNRTQLLDAAEAAFVEMGLNAPLDLIASARAWRGSPCFAISPTDKP